MEALAVIAGIAVMVCIGQVAFWSSSDKQGKARHSRRKPKPLHQLPVSF
jgi:hypothetical protein